MTSTGTMIEWGNNWARGINFRQTNNVAFAGFFSQIGRLYNVHHIWCELLWDIFFLRSNILIQNWQNNLKLLSKLFFVFLGYKSFQDRKESREAAWRKPGWDECVAYTVPLIREMHTRILRPTEFSPTQWKHCFWSSDFLSLERKTNSLQFAGFFKPKIIIKQILIYKYYMQFE